MTWAIGLRQAGKLRLHHPSLSFDIDELSAGQPLNANRHTNVEGEVWSADCRGSRQVFRKRDLATVQETRNMGKGQFRSRFTPSGIAPKSSIDYWVCGTL